MFLNVLKQLLHEVAPNPNVTSADMCLRKSIIKPPDDAPTAEAGIDVSYVLQQLPQRDVYRMILDTKLAPHLPDAKPPEPHFVNAQWSPSCMFEDHRCMISALTDTGCLKFYVPHLSCWIEVVDLSCCWKDYCKSQWPACPRKDVPEMFETLQKRTSQIKLTGMAWGDLIVKSENRRFSLFATISHSGTIAIWKVDNLESLNPPIQKYKPDILITCETNLHNSCALHWMKWNKEKISVIAGDTNGCVKNATFLFNFSNYSISLLHIKDIWNEKDQMRVSCIRNLPLSTLCKEDQRILSVTKNSYILVFLITEDDVISSCHDHIGGLPITGLEVLNEQTFVTCYLSGCFCKYSIDIRRAVEKYEISMSPKVLSTNLPWQDLVCFGIAKTQNSNVWTLCTNPCKMYDHLVVRRPSQLVFINICGSENSCKQNTMMQSVITKPKLRFHWENIEAFRLTYLKQLKAQPTRSLEFHQDIENLTTSQLQMELWRARIVVYHITTTDVVVRNVDACAYVTLLEELIMCRHACKHICTLVERYKSRPLDKKSLQTLGLLRLWLQTWLSRNTPLNNGSEKYYENKNMSETYEVPAKDDTGETKMDFADDAEMNEMSKSKFSDVERTENAVDNDASSVHSFDDAVSTDSNSSSAIFDKTVPKTLNIQHGRVPSSFLKYKLHATYEQVTSVLALPAVPGTLEKELCIFCEQEVQMDIDWRSGACSSNHRLSRCCQCLGQCHDIPYRLCTVCPTVACKNIDCDLEPFCVFCDSPLIVDEKFKRSEFTLSKAKECDANDEEMESDKQRTEVSMESDT